jgi:hypothetical protein
MSNTQRLAAITFRGLLALAMIYSIVWQIEDRLTHNVFRPAEYFSYFTIHSGMIAAVTLAVGAWFAFKRQEDTRLFALVRMSVFAYEVVVGIVYNVLLRDSAPALADGNYQWPTLPNEILHVWAPILIALEWLLFASPQSVRIRANFWSLLFPLAWLAFTLIRGSLTGWWPYPFLDPTGENGVAGMVQYIFIIMFAMIAFSSLALSLLRVRARFSRVAA